MSKQEERLAEAARILRRADTADAAMEEAEKEGRPKDARVLRHGRNALHAKMVQKLREASNTED